LFSRCSLVVLPYIDGSQTGIIPIAYAFKKPVVVTNVGAIPEMVDDGVTGIIIKPKDHIELSKAIISLLSNPQHLREMGDNSFQKMKNDMSWVKIGQKTTDLYLGLF